MIAFIVSSPSYSGGTECVRHNTSDVMTALGTVLSPFLWQDCAQRQLSSPTETDAIGRAATVISAAVVQEPYVDVGDVGYRP